MDRNGRGSKPLNSKRLKKDKQICNKLKKLNNATQNAETLKITLYKLLIDFYQFNYFCAVCNSNTKIKFNTSTPIPCYFHKQYKSTDHIINKRHSKFYILFYIFLDMIYMIG